MSFQIKKFNSIVASMINWVSSNTSLITDFNVGSVARTILEAVALELEELYYQLLRAVEEAIEEAIYRTFNFPRNPSQKATGTVRFTRLTGSEPIVYISRSTLMATNATPPIYFETQEDDSIPSITGTATGGNTVKLIDTTKNFYADEGIIVGSRVINVTDGGETQPAGVLSISTTTNPYDTLNFSTLTNGASFGAGDSYKVIVPYKDVSVIAQVAGTSGNVEANSITVLKTTISNISSITNQASITDGRDEETDLERKARFSLYITSLARATKGALEYAARTVDQVVSAKALDDVRATVFRYYDGTGYNDITSEMRNPGDAAVALFRASEQINDALYFGAEEIYTYINIHLTTMGVVAGTLPVWEYYNGTTWVTLTVTDGTNAGTGPLTQSGTVSFTAPGSWTATTITLGTVSYNLMWVRLRIAAGGVTYSTTPTGDWCSLPPGFGYVYLYCHDGSGNLSATLEASVESAVELYRGCGIIVQVLAPTRYTPTITLSLLVASNYDPTTIGIDAKQAIVDWLNAKVLGEDVYVSEIYQLIMDFDDKAILNTDITECSLAGAGGVQDLIIPSSAVVKPNTSLITVTATTI